MTALSALEASLDGGDAFANAEPDARRIDVLGSQGETIRTLDLSQGVITVGQAAGNQLVLRRLQAPGNLCLEPYGNWLSQRENLLEV